MKQEILEIKDVVVNLSKEWTQTNRNGSTGVGKTFEDILGVEENNSKEADYKGVELKCFRKGKLKSSLQTLFTMEPEWNGIKSRNSRKIILNNYGYSSDGEIKLNTTVTSSENNRGWSLEIENGYVNILNYGDLVARYSTKSIVDKFRDGKLKELVTIGADVKKENRKEYFNYNEMKYYTDVSEENIITLISEGKLKIDIRMNSEKNYGTAFRLNRNLYLDDLYETCVEVL